MPTPSSPGPHPSYIVAATCPDPEDQQQTLRSSSDWHSDQSPHYHVDMDLRDSPEGRGVFTDDASSRSTTASPGPHFASSDGPLPDLGDTSPSTTHSHDSIDSHKMTETDDEPVDSLCDSITAESIQSSRSRYGVGTDLPSSYNTRTHRSSEFEHETEEDYDMPSMGNGFPSTRIIAASPSSFLRAGSRFVGTQQSERQVYDVQVEIKYVDLRESFLCGYLRIQGLTDDHPTLTTYFEGEIIGNKYGFMTNHESWGANDKTDISHWSKFPAFRPYAKQARRGSSVAIKDIAQSEHIFMRWKEHFLVPDHRVRTINGASFEGFYYICFNQVQGEVNGIYFHSKSER
ncbi:hypothetical protein VP1G_08895 [Cytospora mali]|uniref:Glucose-induced degradation protein 4 n=1 Tax=Cytospora mali TaxID=578113 RepID=A0A194VCL3_CYTMA|nr:hypothetical protein VP1G_08895 [Valsa mali var. pyri (nom. inval.)]